MNYINKLIFLIIVTSLSAVSFASDDIPITTENAIICVAKTYPLDKSGNPVEGWVLLELSIDSFGSPEKITVLESSGNETIEKHSIKSIQRQVFTSEIGKVIKRKFNYEFED